MHPTDKFTRALQPLVEFQAPVESELSQQQRRWKLCNALRLAMSVQAARGQRRSRLAAIGGGLLAAAAVISLWVSGPSEPKTRANLVPTLLVQEADAVLSQQEGLKTVEPGPFHRLGSAREIITGEGGTALLVIPQPGHPNLEVRLGRATELSLPDSDAAPITRVQLVRGQVYVSIPSMAAGVTFSVLAPNDRVIGGTEFSAALTPDAENPKKLCVRASRETVVRTRQGAELARLSAGGTWGCAPIGAESKTPVRAPVAAAHVEAVAPQVLALPTTRTPKGSTLGVENELLASALEAQRMQKPEQAKRLLHQLLRKYPSSALRGEAERLLANQQQ